MQEKSWERINGTTCLSAASGGVMRKNLPSTTALLAFEAAARHLSFTRAAIELNLTQTAISHQMKELEARLNVRLFKRIKNRLRLTDEGRDYLDLVKPALTQIAIATDRFASHSQRSPLRIACLSVFATKCLIPHLKEFRGRHNDIELRVTQVFALDNLNRHDFDAAIWYGAGDWQDYDVARLGKQQAFPVCSPKLLDIAPLKTPQDLLHHTIIRTYSPIIADEWPAWLDHVGMQNAGFADELICDGTILSLEAAISGLGIFIGRTAMIQKDLATGRLMEPFNIRLMSNSHYHLVVPMRKLALEKVQKFRAWAMDTFRNDLDET
jgi:LysR family glycine cleavage system transcriptional activator